MQVAFHQIFEKPQNPASQVMYHVRQTPHISRGDLVTATGLSQPTITRAVIALSNAELIHERRDLINTSRPGRPVVPLELSAWPGLMIGIAVDVNEALIGCYDFRGRLLREVRVPEAAPKYPVSEVVEYIIAAIHKIRSEFSMPLRAISLGAASPYWNELSWAKSRLEFEFNVPALACNAAASIGLAEIQQNRNQEHVFVLFAENSVSAAWITATGVDTCTQVLTIDEWLDYAVTQGRPSSIVFSGQAFADPQMRTPIRNRLQSELGPQVNLRITRPELETLRTITASLALAPLQSDPLGLVKATASIS